MRAYEQLVKLLPHGRSIRPWARHLAVKGSKAWWLPKILGTRPVLCDPSSVLEIHMMACRKDILESLWAIKTFAHFSGQSFSLFFHDDGTLTNAEEKLLVQHFPNSEVLRRARTDREMAQVLLKYPHSLRVRADGHWTSIKLFDHYFYGRQPAFLVMDADILFFSRPTEMLDILASDEYFYMEDFQNAYIYSIEELKNSFGINTLPRVNVGFIRLSKSAVNWSLIEAYLEMAKKVEFRSWIEQTLVAMLISDSGLRYRSLPSSYQLMWPRITESTRCHHFCGESRGNYWLKGLPLLWQRGILSSLSR